MKRLHSAGTCRAFLSSGIFEFLKHRQLIYERLAIENAVPPFEPWVYECVATEDSHSEPFFLEALSQSDVMLLLLGSEVRPAVLKEIQHAQSLGIPILRFVKRGERSQSVDDLLNDVHYSEFDFEEDLWEAVRDALLNHLARRTKLSKDIGARTALMLDAPEAYRSLAMSLRLHCDQGDGELALNSLEQSIKVCSNPSDVDELENLRAFVLRRVGRLAEAISIYDRLYAKRLNPRYLISKIVCKVHAGDLDQARDLFLCLPREAETLSHYWLLKAQLEIIGTRPIAAISALLNVRSRRLIDRYPYDYYTLLGHASALAKRHRSAKKHFDRAARVQPSSASIAWASSANQSFELWIMGVREMDLEEPLELIRKARSSFKASLMASDKDVIDQESFMVSLESGLLAMLGHDDEALSILDEFAKTHELSPIGHYNYEVRRMAMFQEPLRKETLIKAALASRSEVIWSNLLINYCIETVNTGVVQPDFLHYLSEFRQRRPESPNLILYDLVSSIRSKSPSELVDELIHCAQERNLLLGVRINALLIAFVLVGQNLLFDEASIILQKAESMGILTIELIAMGMRLLVSDSSIERKMPTAFTEALELAERIPAVQAFERNNHSITKSRAWEDIAYSLQMALAHLGSIYGERVASIRQQIDQVAPIHARASLQIGRHQAIRALLPKTLFMNESDLSALSRFRKRRHS